MSLIVRSAHPSISVSRALGTVVVTVHGDVDVPGARHLGSVLGDIIDGQGNLAVVVDLHDASAVDGSGLSVFATAAEQATERGAVLILSDPTDALFHALSVRGLGRLVRTTRHDERRPSPSVPFGRIAAPGRASHTAGGARSEGQLEGRPNDEDADAYEPNEFGVDDFILDRRRDRLDRVSR